MKLFVKQSRQINAVRGSLLQDGDIVLKYEKHITWSYCEEINNDREILLQYDWDKLDIWNDKNVGSPYEDSSKWKTRYGTKKYLNINYHNHVVGWFDLENLKRNIRDIKLQSLCL